ncbi:hypothetical protein E4U41_000675 [Claviceps citrina]|nr:hypothetical protein E4U41_000675 [Claviceps citrina]
MEAKAIEPSSSMDCSAADLDGVLDAASHPCENGRNAFSTSTSTSTSTSASAAEAPERTAFRPCPNHSLSSPVLMEAYANRPLPRLPPSALSSPEPTGAGEFQGMASLFTERRGPPEIQSSATSIDSTPPSQQYHHHRHHHHHDNYNPLARSSRRSSQKVLQLTGLQVDTMDYQLVSPASVSPDSSSTRSGPKTDDYGVPDYQVVPVLEADDDKNSSRGSSWGPMSPETNAIPAPLSIRKSSADGIGQRMDGLREPFLQMGLDDDTMLSWGSGHGHFSDFGAAGEYHRFAADLATQDSQNSRQASGSSMMSSTTPTKKKRSSLSLAFSAATLFSRRRERSDSTHMPSSSAQPEQAPELSPKSVRQSPEDFIAGPVYSSLSASAAPRLWTNVAPPRPPPAPPLTSAWDSDSDSDGMPGIPSLKDWFAQRATEEKNRVQRRTSSVSRKNSNGQLPVSRLADSFTRRQEREKQIKRERATRRMEERQGSFKKSFAVIPEEFGLSSPRMI